MSLKKFFEVIGINPKWGNVTINSEKPQKEPEKKSGSENKLVPKEEPNK